MVTNQLPIPKFSKIDHFDGCNYNTWKQKLPFVLETISISWVLTKPKSTESEDKLEPARSGACTTQDTTNHFCKNYILNTHTNKIYDVYCKMKHAKNTWNTLAKKYVTEDARSGKYVVGKFLDYKMVDNKSLKDRIIEFQKPTNEFSDCNPY